MQKKDGTMKQIISSKHLSSLIFILSLIVGIKVIWIVVSILFLPNSGENYHEPNRVKKLYYRVRFTSKSNGVATQLTAEEIERQKREMAKKMNLMQGYRLLGLYHNHIKKVLVITVEKANKTTVLAKGEEIDGFKLISAGEDYVLFKKSGKSFKLSLSKITKQMKRVSNHSHQQNNSMKSSTIVESETGVKEIPRTLLSSYVKDSDKIWKDIAIVQNKKNGVSNGFKINYVKKGSDFEKLGLKRNDVLIEINAEPLNSLSTAMKLFNEINTIENLTLTVLRNGNKEEIEYEIQ